MTAVTILRAAALLSLVLASAVSAGEREFLGWGGAFGDDLLGDGEDRWRSSTHATSLLWGPEWTGRLPQGVGRLLELRFESATITPENLSAPVPGDRPYAGSYTLGLHTHFRQGPLHISLGGGLTMTGPQTGLGSFQRELNELLGVAPPSDAVLQAQIGNAVYPDATVEVSRPLRLSPGLTAQPYVEAKAGVETLLRVGGDVIFGSWVQGDALVRDTATGHFYTATRGGGRGLSLVIGGDLARVADSRYLPGAGGYRPTDARGRLRAGVNWQGEAAGLFYGLTWLGREFVGQPDGQIIGTLNLRISF